MKIAVIAPPWVPIPPPKYGGIETSIYNLVEGLTELGENVTLFAHRESRVSCRLVPYLENPSLDTYNETKGVMEELCGKYAYARAAYEKTDIIHDHTLFRSPLKTPAVHTVHAVAREGSLKQCIELAENPKNHFVAVSKTQIDRYKRLGGAIDFVDYVHYAIDVHSIKWTKEKSDFSFFVGRANWAKCIDVAIRVASKARSGLIMAVKIAEEFEKRYFTQNVQPWIDRYPKDLFFQFHTEIPREFLFDLFRRARCTLFTSHRDDPFGLVVLESMASGTPVIAMKRGTAAELIEDRKSGMLVDTEEEMVKAMKEIDKIRPEDCRLHTEENFSRKRMAEKYLSVYKRIL